MSGPDSQAPRLGTWCGALVGFVGRERRYTLALFAYAMMGALLGAAAGFVVAIVAGFFKLMESLPW